MMRRWIACWPLSQATRPAATIWSTTWLSSSCKTRPGANLNSSLRKTCNNLKDKASVNNAAVIHDRKLCPPVINSRVTAVLPYPRWDGSESQRLLKLDVNDGMHKRMVPCKLRDTRNEYRFFPLDVLGKHIHQEVRSRRETAYWLDKVPCATTTGRPVAFTGL